MSTLAGAAEAPRPRLSKKILVSLLSLALLFATLPPGLSASQNDQAPPSDQAPPPNQGAAPAYSQQSPEQLQQLVAPIALYPDSLVAQILAASTFPEQVVEADRWVQNHPDLKGEALAQAVDQQPWDPECQGAHWISVSSWKYGQEPVVDIISRRRLLQPATRCDERCTSDASESRSRQEISKPRRSKP